MTASDVLVRTLRLTRVDGVLLHHPSSIRYFTGGFTGEGVVLITAERRVIVTDFRFAEQARMQSPGFECVLCSERVGHTQQLTRICRESGISSLRYEHDGITVRQLEKLEDLLGDQVLLTSICHKHDALRRVKRPEELACVREAYRISAEAFAQALRQIRPGMTEMQLRIALDTAQLEAGAEELAFPAMVAFGERTSLCHATAGRRVLQAGDVVLMDFGCKVRGYCSDMTRMAVVGRAPDGLQAAYQAVLEAQEKAMETIHPGARCCDVDAAARQHLEALGYGAQFGHGLGHGIGLDVHERPTFDPVCADKLEPGMVMTVESGVYFPGEGGVRVEDTVLVTESGYELLTCAGRELISL